jgi:hypothetical protein
MGQFTIATLFGGSVVVPQVWNITASGVGPYTLNPAPLNTDSKMFIVENGGIIVNPSDYVIGSSSITFLTSKSGATSIRNFGVARNIIASTSIIEDNSITTSKILNGAVTLAKIQNIAAGTFLGRDPDEGSGPPTELTLEPLGKDLIASQSAADARDLLGLGSLAQLDSVSPDQIDPNAVQTDKIASSAVTAVKIASNNIDSSKLTLNGPRWDNTRVKVQGFGTAETGGTAPYIYLNHNGTIAVQGNSAGGNLNLWTGSSPSAITTTTIRADGVPTAVTDLTTKAYVDAKPFFNLNPQTITGTNLGSGSSIMNIEFDLSTVDGKRLIIANQTFNTGKGTGSHYIRLKNPTGTAMKVMLLWSFFDWYPTGGTGSAVVIAPISMNVLPWAYETGPYSQGMTTISSGGYAYFRGVGSGWGNGTSDVVDTTNSGVIAGMGSSTGTACNCKFWLLRLD